MPEFASLTDAQELALERFMKYRTNRTRLELRRLSALATLRLGEVIAGTLDRTDPDQAGYLATLAERDAKAYGTLRHLDGAIRVADTAARAQLTRLFPEDEA